MLQKKKFYLWSSPCIFGKPQMTKNNKHICNFFQWVILLIWIFWVDQVHKINVNDLFMNQTVSVIDDRKEFLGETKISFF